VRVSVMLAAVTAAATGVVAGPAMAGAMKTGGLTSQPIGHYEFCRTYRDLCMPKRGSYEPIAIDRGVWADILDVNSSVNMVIEPRSDLEIYGREEVWTYPDAAGDCEDYVLLKRQMLINKPDGEGHAVLTVRTDRGDFVLDNLRTDVRLWTDTEYTYLKRQSERHAGLWVSIEMPDRVVVGSVK